MSSLILQSYGFMFLAFFVCNAAPIAFVVSVDDVVCFRGLVVAHLRAFLEVIAQPVAVLGKQSVEVRAHRREIKCVWERHFEGTPAKRHVPRGVSQHVHRDDETVQRFLSAETNADVSAEGFARGSLVCSLIGFASEPNPTNWAARG
jgi:hypothetical protein